MYTLIQDEKDPSGFNNIVYSTPCGTNMVVSMVKFGSSPEETVVLFPDAGATTLKVIEKVAEIIRAHQS